MSNGNPRPLSASKHTHIATKWLRSLCGTAREDAELSPPYIIASRLLKVFTSVMISNAIQMDAKRFGAEDIFCCEPMHDCAYYQQWGGPYLYILHFLTAGSVPGRLGP